MAPLDTQDAQGYCKYALTFSRIEHPISDMHAGTLPSPPP